MEVTDALRGLRSTRYFSGRQVPIERVSDWLETARWCGSSRNSQPWRFVVVRDPRTKCQLAQLGDDAEHLASAPVVVALAAVEGPYPFSTVFDLGRVAQSLMVSAHANGVRSCVAVFGPAERIDTARRLLDVPQELRLDLAISFGYPLRSPVGGRARSAAGPPSPADRLPFTSIVSWERFGIPVRDT
jgi:nitroreductase